MKKIMKNKYVITISEKSFNKILKKEFRKTFKQIKIGDSLSNITYKYVCYITSNLMEKLGTLWRLILVGETILYFSKRSYLSSFICVIGWLFLVVIKINIFIDEMKFEEYEKNKTKFMEIIMGNITKKIIESFCSSISKEEIKEIEIEIY